MLAQVTVKQPCWGIHQAWRILQAGQVAIACFFQNMFVKQAVQPNTPTNSVSTHETIAKRLRNIRLRRQRAQTISAPSKKDFLTKLQMSGARLTSIRESSRKARVQWLGLDQEYMPTADMPATKALIAWYYVLSMAPPTGTSMDQLLEPDLSSTHTTTTQSHLS